MATDISSPMTEAELLHFYLGRRLETGARKEPLEKLLVDFGKYRRELEQFRATLREAEAQCDRGEARPLDLDDIIRRGRERMAAEGITD
jgi:hypothetical protein